MLALGLGRGISLTTLTFLLLFSPLLPYPVAFAAPIAQPGTEGLEVIVKSTGPVQAIYQGYNSSLYSNDLYLVVDDDRAHDKLIFNNKTSATGIPVPLGSYTAGTKLRFRLHVNDTGKDYYTGAGDRNPDGHTHARAQAEWKPNETLVSFEDLLDGPFDYNDLSFSFTPTTVGGQPPGWYKNSGAGGKDSILYEDSKLRIVWENSYVYQYPGTDPLYWYAQVVYHNLDKDNPLTITCTGHTDASFAKEHIRGTQGIPPNGDGYVPAEETVCTHKPDFSRVIEPGGALYDWAIFHNVPQGQGGQVRLEWEWQGVRSSGWVNPWQTPVSAPHPTVCPPELETSLKTCQSQMPEGKASVKNLIVLVHGCCQDAQGKGVYEWRELADTMIGEIIKTQTPAEWEIVVWDWHKDAPDTGADQVGQAYTAAYHQGYDLLGPAIAKYPYKYVHFIGHSAGARLIWWAARRLAIEKVSHNPKEEWPFIHLTFLDAYQPNDDDYGNLYEYPKYYSEQYVDRTPSIISPLTSSCLVSAFNFDITDWKDNNNVAPDKGDFTGHQWPRYWYQQSVTTRSSSQTLVYAYGYSLSFEGGNGSYDALSGWYLHHRQCHLGDVGTKCQIGDKAPACW